MTPPFVSDVQEKAFGMLYEGHNGPKERLHMIHIQNGVCDRGIPHHKENIRDGTDMFAFEKNHIN